MHGRQRQRVSGSVERNNGMAMAWRNRDNMKNKAYGIENRVAKKTSVMKISGGVAMKSVK